MAEPDLFTRLVDPAGVPGAITPRVQSLFESGAAPPDPREMADDHEQAIAPGPGTAVTDAARASTASPRPPAATPVAPEPPAAPPSSAARIAHPQDPTPVEPEQEAARPDRVAHRLDRIPRPAEGGDTGRLRPREEPVVTPPATPPTRAAQRTAARAAGRRGTRAEAVTPAPPPAVTISIGRIEVRAIPAPQPPTASVPDPPGEPRGLTLAQYLRGDDGRPR
ncbi:hypothetical protein ACTMSW_09265 [Micromonospora sp. BQ11]|uniref:hypothetical protein n=1 Tax=Micromonospora sp. BQ11 TaxID=3452212 RepID=UPI003F8889E0